MRLTIEHGTGQQGRMADNFTNFYLMFHI